jgi:putative transposase
VARDRGLALRTARRWAAQYHREGLAGLARKGRSGRGKRRLSDTLRQAIEGLALKKPPLSAASIHRQAVALAEHLGEDPPGYDAAYNLARALDPLAEMTTELERFLVDGYHNEPHTTTGFKPQERWTAGGFLPRMPESLEQLDLLLTVPKTRRVHPDGIRFSGLRYIGPLLAAYVGEDVLLRYDPRDITEVRGFHEGRFVCRAVCQELAGETVPLREVIRARGRRRRELRRTIQDRRKVVDPLLEARRGCATEGTPSDAPEIPPEPQRPARTLKRYADD